MSEQMENPEQGQDKDSTEIALDNIDEILMQEDPGFVESLSDIEEGAGEVSDVELETIDVDVTDGDDEEVEVEARMQRLVKKIPILKVFGKLTEQVKKFILQRYVIWKGKVRLAISRAIDHFKTWPDRFKKLFSDVKNTISTSIRSVFEAFASKTRAEKAMIFLLALGIGFILVMVSMNLNHSRWIPFISKPLLKNLGEVASESWDYDVDTGTIPFLAAFPQAKHNYLFPKVVVNLKTAPGSNQFTMGAFEFFVEVDSKDTAIEVKSRQVELHDLMQRTVEGFSYDSLQSERGKERLKQEIKKALNQKVVQGWVKDVYIKFFITKP